MNPSEIQIREFQANDEAAIVALFEKVFGRAMTHEEWSWKYTANGAHSPIAWLAWNEVGDLIGHAGAIPLRGWNDGAPVEFFQVVDVMVRKDARGAVGQHNLFTNLARRLLESLAVQWPSNFGYGFPGQRPFKLGEYARIYGELDTLDLLSPVARETPWPSIIQIAPLDWIDRRLDRIWANRSRDHQLSLVRDREYLCWRYRDHPLHRYELVGIYFMGVLVGWFVLTLGTSPTKLVDMLIPRRWLSQALAGLCRVKSVHQGNSLQLTLPRSWRRGLTLQANTTEIVVASMIWKLNVTTSNAKERLYYSLGDLDIF